jgi:hypothetical protein
MVVAAAAVAAFISASNMLVLAAGVLAIAGVAYCSERNPAASDRVLLARKAVLVTGCDTGLGHALALRLSRLGVHTFAGCLHAGQGGGASVGAMRLREEDNAALHVLQLDVTSDDQVAAALDQIKRKLGNNGEALEPFLLVPTF